jgi:hypothetical protein
MINIGIYLCFGIIIFSLLLALPAARFSAKGKNVNSISKGNMQIDYKYLLKIVGSIVSILVVGVLVFILATWLLMLDTNGHFAEWKSMVLLQRGQLNPWMEISLFIEKRVKNGNRQPLHIIFITNLV